MITMTYMNAELELVSFAAEDVLATSNGGATEPVPTTKCPGQITVLPEEEL